MPELCRNSYSLILKKIEIVLFSGILETNSFGIIGCDLPKASLSMITFNENNDWYRVLKNSTYKWH